MFQFYDSPIKRFEGGSFKNGAIKGFNSMIVRLKEIIGFLGNTGRTTFQFYDSPIKSTRYFYPFCVLTGFNSMIVRLKESYQW